MTFRPGRKRNAIHDTLRVLSWARPYWMLIIPTLAVLMLEAAVTVSPAVVISLFVAVVLRRGEEFGKLEWVVDYFPFLTSDGAPLAKLSFFALLLIGIGALTALVGFAAQWLQKYVMNRVTVDMRCTVCEHLLSLPMSFHHEERRGDLYARLTNDLAASREAVDIMLSDLISKPFKLISCAALAFYANWLLALAVFVVILFPLRALGKLGSRIKKTGRGRQAKMSELTHMMVQFLSGIRIVKAFSMEEQEMRQFYRENANFVRRAMKVVRQKAFSDAMFTLVSFGGIAIVLFAGGYMLMTPWTAMTADDLILFLGALGLMYSPSRELVKAYNKLQDSLAGTERVLEVLETEPQIMDAPDAIDLPRIQHSIRFRNVTFSYDTQPVLKNIDLEVKAGETVAIVGRSGAGKSTLVDLIPRFYDPLEGSVEIDGIDLRRVKRRSLLSQIAIVTQDPFLFDTTILENIRYGRPNAGEEEVIEAARAANIADFIDSLPEKYYTVVGERGAKLSGGQRQRITIARAIIKDAPILILDEATSSLDLESEALIQDAVERLMAGRTTFVIAHRLTTVEHADKIIVLKDGEIVEMGTHESLLAQRGEYWRLYKMDFRSLNGQARNPGPANAAL